MRTFIFLTFLFLSSYCIEKKADNVNQIIDELVELNRIILTPAQKIGRVVAQIREAARDSAKAFDAFYSRVKTNCNAGSGYLKSFTDKLKGDKINAQASINHARNRVKVNQAAHSKLKKQLKDARAALEQAHKRQGREAHEFNQRLLEAESKLTTIRHVRNIVVDELLNGKAPASLIQVNTISTKLNELKTMVEKDNDSLFTSVIGNLLEMASQQNLNDQTTLRKFLGSLRKLNRRIKAWRTAALANHKKIQKINAASNAAKLNSIRATSKLAVEAASAVKGGLRHIDELSNAIGLIEKALARKQKESDNWEKLCKDQSRVAGIFQNAHKALRSRAKQVHGNIVRLQ